METNKACTITLCRGMEGRCHNALDVPPDLLWRLEEILEQSPWLRRLQQNHGDALRGHQRLRLALAACANGCSRPQTADIGLLAAECPVPPESCHGCGACVAACPDGLVSLQEGAKDTAPVIETRECLNCGLCRRACPDGLMAVAQSGLRLQVGGKLGRRPLLAAELPGILRVGDVLNVLQRCLLALEEANTGAFPAVYRLAELRRRQGLAFLGDVSCAC